jgi:arylsulfatase A-like enzyme
MRILVIEASALHLGFLGCYGNDWVATPNLDRLAAESVVFDQHFADCPELLPTQPAPQRSAATGIYCFPSPALEAPGAPAVDGTEVCYESIAALKGFATSAIKAIDRMREQSHAILWIEGPSLAPPWRLPKSALTAYVEEYEDEEQKEGPLTDPNVGLACLDMDDLDRLHAAYAGVATFFDAQLGRVLGHLRKKKWIDDLLVCLTARCGLPLGEHGATGVARAWLHDELVHVPLLLRLPAAAKAGERVAALTQSTDLAPTLGDHLNLPAAPMHGRSLWPLIHGDSASLRPYAASGLRVGDSEEWLLRTPELAFLLPIAVPPGDPARRPQLYVKPDDRWEVNDLAPRHEEYSEHLENTLRQFVAATRQPGPLHYPAVPEEIS